MALPVSASTSPSRGVMTAWCSTPARFCSFHRRVKTQPVMFISAGLPARLSVLLIQTLVTSIPPGRQGGATAAAAMARPSTSSSSSASAAPFSLPVLVSTKRQVWASFARCGAAMWMTRAKRATPRHHFGSEPITPPAMNSLLVCWSSASPTPHS